MISSKVSSMLLFLILLLVFLHIDKVLDAQKEIRKLKETNHVDQMTTVQKRIIIPRKPFRSPRSPSFPTTPVPICRKNRVIGGCSPAIPDPDRALPPRVNHISSPDPSPSASKNLAPAPTPIENPISSPDSSPPENPIFFPAPPFTKTSTASLNMCMFSYSLLFIIYMLLFIIFY